MNLINFDSKERRKKIQKSKGRIIKIIDYKLKQMIQEQNNPEQYRYKTIIIDDSQKEFDIGILLQGIEHYNFLSLQFISCEESLIFQVGESLKDQRNLKGLNITFKQYALHSLSTNSIKVLYRSLKWCHLNVLKVQIENQFIYMSVFDIFIELSNSIDQQSSLQILELTFPSLKIKDINQMQQIKDVFSNLPSLKELRMKVVAEGNSNDNENQQILNEIIVSINQIKSIQSLKFEINKRNPTMHPQELLWSFNNLSSLQELELISEYDCPLQAIRLSEKLQYLSQLVKLSISIRIFEDSNQLGKLFNTILNLNLLSELIVCVELMKSAISISIGEDVGENLNLKMFKLRITNQSYNRSGVVHFRKKIVKIKGLERLCLDFKFHFLSDESFQVLQKWRDEWTLLKEFVFENQNQFYDDEVNLKMFAFLRDCFFYTKAIIQLKIHIQQIERSDLLTGLMQLKNLQTFTCKNLYNKYNQNIEKSYLECFQNLQNLRELFLEEVLSKKEIICIGSSFPYLAKLQKLKICFYYIYHYEHFDIFCRNLQGLTNLRYLSLSQVRKYNGNDMNINDAEMLIKSIQTLTNLRQLYFGFHIENSEQNNLNFLLYKLIQDLSQLNVLKVKVFEKTKNKNMIQRLSKKLILLTIY